MAERRKFKRVELAVSVKCRLIDERGKTSISGDILSKTKNLSEGGMLLEWPHSWYCDNCSNCLSWIYNADCKLKEKGCFEEESNRVLTSDTCLSLQLVPSDDLEPVEATGRIAWVNRPEGRDRDSYNIGISFFEKKNEKKDPGFNSKILAIKKRFGINRK